MHPIDHAKISAVRFGGTPESYLPIHLWFDESRAFMPDIRHRAFRHHLEGVMAAEKVFGLTIKNSLGKDVPVRYIGHQHVRDDLGFVPSVEFWFRNLTLQPWMQRGPYARTHMKTREIHLDVQDQEGPEVPSHDGLPVRPELQSDPTPDLRV